VVFAKCWLAKHWVAPQADYVVFDAAARWPIEARRFDLVQCHDAFYFLPDQPTVADRLRAAVADDGVLAISHIHNAGYRTGAKGPARAAAEWQAMFPDVTVYDEEELRLALLAAATPAPCDWADDPEVEAWSLVEGGDAPRKIEGGVAMPSPDATLRPNPLLGEDGAVRWPSPRWRDEYGPGCLWANPAPDLPFPADPVRQRRLVDLPERW